MKLHYLGLWMLTMPALSATIAPQTTGTIYVNARFVTTPCQPIISMQRAVNHVSEPVYQFNVSFAHCVATKKHHQRLPFSLTLGNEKLRISAPQVNNSFSFSVPSNNSARRLEMRYD